MKIYIAGPLFSDGEKAFNERVDAVIRSCGHRTYLPQRDGGQVAELPDTVEGKPKARYIFDLDRARLAECDLFLFLMDGRVPDEGASFAMGYSYALGKRCVIYKTDVRTCIDGEDNLMLSCAAERILRGEGELRAFLSAAPAEQG